MLGLASMMGLGSPCELAPKSYESSIVLLVIINRHINYLYFNKSILYYCILYMIFERNRMFKPYYLPSCVMKKLMKLSKVFTMKYGKTLQC